MLLLQYPKCSTCQKAKKWLEAIHIADPDRPIGDDKPSVEELKQWYEKSGLPLKKFFNTSGKVYREMQLKDKLPDLDEEEQLKMLASNGMLVKRPLVIDDTNILVGFQQAQWEEVLLR